MLIIFAGLPGSGKTTLARKLAHRLDAVYIRIDSIEQALKRSNLGSLPMEDAGYRVAYRVAEDNLRLGRTVIGESVNPIEQTRSAWLDVANRTGSLPVEVEVVCSDPIEHRKRVETRTSDIADFKLPSWQEVLDREYEDWPRDHIVIDTANRPIQECIDELAEKIGVAH